MYAFCLLRSPGRFEGLQFHTQLDAAVAGDAELPRRDSRASSARTMRMLQTADERGPEPRSGISESMRQNFELICLLGS
jgi:hypothetical protein